jgi:hypothetical protein
MFFLQKTNGVNSIPTSRTAHNKSSQVGPGWSHEPPPVPYVPEKDKVHKTVSTMKGLQLKTLIGKDTTLHLPVWNSGTKESILMHLLATLDAIKKRGHFQAYKEAQVLYLAKKEAAEQAKAGLSLLAGASEGSGISKKSSKKAKETQGVTKVPDNVMRATFQADLEKAKAAAENAKGATTVAANKMFVFYAICSLSRQSMCGTRLLKADRRRPVC